MRRQFQPAPHELLDLRVHAEVLAQERREPLGMTGLTREVPSEMKLGSVWKRFAIAERVQAANTDLDVTLCAQVGRNFSAGDHHLFSDHGFLRRESIRLTLVVTGPDVLAGEVSTPIRSVDLVPTVLDLAGLEARPGEIDGRSLVPFFRPDKGPAQLGLIEALESQ